MKHIEIRISAYNKRPTIGIKIIQNKKILGTIFRVNSIYAPLCTFKKNMGWVLKETDTKETFSNDFFIFNTFADAASALLSSKHGRQE